MSKRKKIFLIIIAVFIIAFLYVCISSFHAVSYRYAYTGDRITVNLYATIDGEQIKAKDISVNTADIIYGGEDTEYYNITDSICVKDNDNYVTFSIKANRYGDYHIYADICGYEFRFEAYQWNWWDVQNSNLYIDIDSEKNEYKTHEEHSYLSEETATVNESKSEEIYKIDEINYQNIGRW